MPNRACLVSVAVLTVWVMTDMRATRGSSALPTFKTVVNLEPTSEDSANVSMGDLDGDGDLDLVLAKGRHEPLVDRVLLNDGKAGFVASDLGPKADRTYTAALADLDGDGDLDVITSNDTPDDKLVYLNDGKGRFSIAGTWGAGAWSTRNAAVVDLNGDGRPDVVAANRPGPSYVCLNEGGGRFASGCIPIPAESATSIVPADFDKDGFVDLAVPSRDGGQSRIYFNDGKAGFARTAPFGPPNAAARVGAAADFDGDGWIDLAMGDEAAASLVVYMNDRKGGLVAGFRVVDKARVPYARTARRTSCSATPGGHTRSSSTTAPGGPSPRSRSATRRARPTASRSATSIATGSPISRWRGRTPRTCCIWAANRRVRLRRFV